MCSQVGSGAVGWWSEGEPKTGKTGLSGQVQQVLNEDINLRSGLCSRCTLDGSQDYGVVDSRRAACS